MMFVFYITQHDFLSIRPCCCKWHYFILFYGWMIFHCVYVPRLLYPCLCWWPFRLFPCPGYCKQCCSEHGGSCSLRILFLSVILLQKISPCLYDLFMYSGFNIDNFPFSTCGFWINHFDFITTHRGLLPLVH